MKKRNGILARIGIVALVLTLVTTTMTSGTLAKYITQADATVTAMVAKWDPSIVIGGQDAMATAVEFDLMDNYTGGTVNDIESGLIAPGTGSSFDIVLDATNSQVNTEYAVYMFYNTESVANDKEVPKNLVFATNDTFTSSVTAKGVNGTDFTALLAGTKVPEGTGEGSGYIAGGDLIAVGESKDPDFNQTIYWRWPYQTAGDEAAENTEDTDAGSAATSTDLKYAIVVVMTQKGA